MKPQEITSLKILTLVYLFVAGCLEKESGNCKKNKEMWTDEHCTKRVCKSKVLRNGEAKSKIGIKEASKYLTICNNFNLPHFGFF